MNYKCFAIKKNKWSYIADNLLVPQDVEDILSNPTNMTKWEILPLDVFLQSKKKTELYNMLKISLLFKEI